MTSARHARQTGHENLIRSYLADQLSRPRHFRGKSMDLKVKQRETLDLLFRIDGTRIVSVGPPLFGFFAGPLVAVVGRRSASSGSCVGEVFSGQGAGGDV